MSRQPPAKYKISGPQPVRPDLRTAYSTDNGPAYQSDHHCRLPDLGDEECRHHQAPKEDQPRRPNVSQHERHWIPRTGRYISTRFTS